MPRPGQGSHLMIKAKQEAFLEIEVTRSLVGDQRIGRVVTQYLGIIVDGVAYSAPLFVIILPLPSGSHRSHQGGWWRHGQLPAARCGNFLKPFIASFRCALCLPPPFVDSKITSISSKPS